MIPLIIAGAIGAAAGGGILGAGASSGVGKNPYRAATFGKTDGYDPNRFEYGREPGGANEAAGRYQGLAQAAQLRSDPHVNYAQANYDRMQGLAARGQQAQAADLMMGRAQGLVPSIAQMQADRQMQQAAASQASAAASARGAGGLALAQQNAMGNTATMQSAISNQAQINAAQERMAAEQAAYGAYSGLRGGDLASQQQAAAQSQYQADLAMRQRAINDAMTMGMTQNEMGVRNQQLNAGLQQQTIMANSLAGAQTQNMGVNQANANREMEYLKGAMGLVQGAADSSTGAMAGGGVGKRAAGGPVNAGSPYLVGEHGPELIVPTGNGHVIPTEQTLGLLGGAPRRERWTPQARGGGLI